MRYRANKCHANADANADTKNSMFPSPPSGVRGGGGGGGWGRVTIMINRMNRDEYRHTNLERYINSWPGFDGVEWFINKVYFTAYFKISKDPLIHGLYWVL